jgi:hypothetical protein
MKRQDILDEAKKCVCGHREQDYGTPENNFETIAQLWSAYIEASHPNLKMAMNEFTAKDVAVMMALLKIARIARGSSPDSYVDLAGYAACAGEIDIKDKPTRSNENTCIVCGASIPEGLITCPACDLGGGTL